MTGQTWITLIAAVIVGVPTLWVGLATVRQNRQGAKTTAALEDGKLDLARFEAFEKRSDAALARQDARIVDLEDALEHEKSQRRLSNSYARVLAQVLRDHQMPVPQPPAGLGAKNA